MRYACILLTRNDQNCKMLRVLLFLFSKFPLTKERNIQIGNKNCSLLEFSTFNTRQTLGSSRIKKREPVANTRANLQAIRCTNDLRFLKNYCLRLHYSQSDDALFNSKLIQR